MAVQSIKINHDGKTYKVYKGQQGGMYIVRKNRKVYLQNGAGFLGKLKAKATKGFAAVKNTAKSAAQAVSSGVATAASAVGNVASDVASSVGNVASDVASSVGNVASGLRGIVGGTMYVHMSEQLGGKGISVRINGKIRKVFTTKNGKFYYKQQGKKVYIKQDGAGFASMFKTIASKAMPFVKDFAMEQGQAMLQTAMTPTAVAPLAVAPLPLPLAVAAIPRVAVTPVITQAGVVPTLVQAGGARMVGPAYAIMQTGGSGLKVRTGGKTVHVFVTKGGRFYYKQNGKKINVQRGSGMFGNIMKSASKLGKKAITAAKNNPAMQKALADGKAAAAAAVLEAKLIAQQQIEAKAQQLIAQQLTPQAVVQQIIPPVQQPVIMVPQTPVQQPVIMVPQTQPILVQAGGSCSKKNCPCGKKCKCGKNCKCTKKGGSCGRKNCPCGNNCKCGKNCKC
jgi:hypothetical protein